MGNRRAHILIVDDERDTCDNLNDLLTDSGFRVDTAHDGLTALRLMEQNFYDVALLDIRMPGMNGLELYGKMKQTSAGTVAIIVTAYAAGDMARSALEAGAWRIVSKPVDFPHLLQHVEEAIE